MGRCSVEIVNGALQGGCDPGRHPSGRDHECFCDRNRCIPSNLAKAWEVIEAGFVREVDVCGPVSSYFSAVGEGIGAGCGGGEAYHAGLEEKPRPDELSQSPWRRWQPEASRPSMSIRWTAIRGRSLSWWGTADCTGMPICRVSRMPGWMTVCWMCSVFKIRATGTCSAIAGHLALAHIGSRGCGVFPDQGAASYEPEICAGGSRWGTNRSTAV